MKKTTLIMVLVGVSGFFMGFFWPAPDIKPTWCECGGSECPYTDKTIPKDTSDMAEMHYWSIE